MVRVAGIRVFQNCSHCHYKSVSPWKKPDFSRFTSMATVPEVKRFIFLSLDSCWGSYKTVNANRKQVETLNTITVFLMSVKFADICQGAGNTGNMHFGQVRI